MSQTSIPLAASNNSILTSEESEDKQLEHSRTFIQRAFAPLSAGAMRGAIFALLASAMGSGMFNLPYRIGQIGVGAYFIYVLAGGLFSYVGMYLISRLIMRFKIRSYSEMCEKSYGSGFRKVAQFCLIIYPWGITVCFQVIFAKFMLQILDDTFGCGFFEKDGRSTDTYSTKGNMARIITIVSAILINLFLILKKQIALLQKISIIGVISVVFNVGIVAVTFLLGFTIKDTIGKDVIYQGITGIKWSQINWFTTNGWDGFSQHMQGLATLIFCYVNHQLVFPLVFDLKNPTKKRLDKVFYRVHITQIIAYTTVGLTGYLLLEEHMDDYPISPMVMGSIMTTTMTIGKVFMTVALFVAVPLNLYPAKEVIYQTFSIARNNRNHIIISLLLALSGTVIAIFFQSVNSYFGLLGGTAGVMMAGGIPAICYYKLKGPRTLNQKMLLIFMAFISLLGIFGAVLSVIDVL